MCRVRGLSSFSACSRMSSWVLMAAIVSGGCARLPYTTQVVHEDRRVVVVLQREPRPVPYSHPTELQANEVAAILAGYSFREKQRLPLRWYAEEVPPKAIFRPDELQTLVPHVVEALKKAAPDERVYFQVLAPGMNPAYERDTTAGWIALSGPYFHLILEHFHAQFPVRREEPWDLRYPALPPEPGTYLLYFEPGRFWGVDPVTDRASVQFREFLKSPIPALRK